MNIVFLTPHTRIAGGTKVIFTLAQGLAKKGHKVTVAALKIKEIIVPWFSREKLFTFVNYKKLTQEDFNSADTVVTFADGPTISDIKSKRILFFQGVVPNYITGSTETTDLKLKTPYTKVITTSSWLKDLVVSRRVNMLNVKVVPPGIDSCFIPVQRPVNNFPVLGGLHHNDKLKNFDDFVRVVEILFTDKIKIKPLVLSAEREFSNVKRFDKLSIPYSVVKNPPQSLLPSVYSSCDVWYSTSQNEGFGLTTLEAMACGVPVVWNANGGLKDFMKHEENCMVVRNAKEAVEATKEIFKNKDLKKLLITNGKNLASSFTWDACINAFERELL